MYKPFTVAFGNIFFIVVDFVEYQRVEQEVDPSEREATGTSHRGDQEKTTSSR